VKVKPPSHDDDASAEPSFFSARARPLAILQRLPLRSASLSLVNPTARAVALRD
jgi:hypothetical protein